MTPDSSAATQYVTFRVAGHFFGIASVDVQEVLQEQRVTHVPLAPAAVEGLINLRGQIVPAVDVRRRLRLAEEEKTANPPSIVVRTPHGPVSLQVDLVGDVLELGASSYEPPPVNLDADLLALVRGVYKLEDQLLLVLDAGQTAGLGSSGAAPRAAATSA